MRSEIEKLWLTDAGKKLLRRQADGTFLILEDSFKPSSLRELAEVIQAALSDDSLPLLDTRPERSVAEAEELWCSAMRGTAKEAFDVEEAMMRR